MKDREKNAAVASDNTSEKCFIVTICSNKYMWLLYWNNQSQL